MPLRNALKTEYDDAREAHAEAFRALQRAVNARDAPEGTVQRAAEAEARAYLRLVRARNALLDAPATRATVHHDAGGATHQRHGPLHAPAG